MSKPGKDNPNWRGGKSKCFDCGKELAQRYSSRKNILRCRPCYTHFITKKPENHPNYRGGIPKCKDCGKPTRDYSSERCGPCYHKSHIGENSPVFREKLTYKYLHVWLKKQFGQPKKCEFCQIEGKFNGKKWSIHWANRSEKYLRKRSDWLHLCVKCHRNYDLQKR